MKGGYLAKRYLYSEITARYHDSIRSFYYLVEVINALAVFYLADYLNRFAAVFFKQFAHVVYVLRRADEAGSDKVDFLLNSKENIAFVSFDKISNQEIFNLPFSYLERNVQDLGEQAARLLVRRFNDPDGPQQRVVVMSKVALLGSEKKIE